MTTKEQERQAIEKIRKIVKELGENSYVGFAMEGVLELAEDNIREDTAYSMKKNAEIAWERAEKESKLLNAELGTAKKITEENNKAIAKLKADIYKLKANEVPEELIKEMYNMAYDKEAEMIEKMEETADQMADASIAGEDVQKFAEDYKAQKEKRNRYAKMMDTLDARERKSMSGHEHCRTSGKSKVRGRKNQQRQRSRSGKRNTIEPDVGDNTYHRADGKVETKICDMGECAECNEPTHDRKLHPVSERDGAHGVHEQL